MQTTWSWFRIKYVTRNKVHWLVWRVRNALAGLRGYCVLDAEFDECQGIKVWLNQGEIQEISNRSVCLYAKARPGEWAQGWVDVLAMDKNGHVIAAPDGLPATERVYGLVMWERDNG